MLLELEILQHIPGAAVLCEKCYGHAVGEARMKLGAESPVGFSGEAYAALLRVFCDFEVTFNLTLRTWMS